MRPIAGPAPSAKRGGAHAVLAGLAEDEAVKQMRNNAFRYAGGSDILVSNAGGAGAVKEEWSATQPTTWAATYGRKALAALCVTNRVLALRGERGADGA